jgi:hypothetical protein
MRSDPTRHAGARASLAVAIVLGVGSPRAAAQTELAFEISQPEAIDVAWHAQASLTETITIRNTGKTAINALSVVATQLTDPTTMQRIEVGAQPLSASCAPGQYCSFAIDLPRAAHAGTYAGAVVLDADGVVRRSIPVTIRSRGPKTLLWIDESNAPWLAPRLPAMLFGIVVAFGWAASTALDWWVAGGGRRRAQARQLLAASRDAIAGSLGRVRAWLQQVQLQALAATVSRWQLALTQIDQLEAGGSRMTPDELEREANAIARLAEASTMLWGALSIAAERFGSDAARLGDAAARLDAIEPGALDLAAYREACQKALDDAAAGAADRGSMTVSAPPQAVRAGRVRTHLLDWLQVVVTWLVVGAIAYVTFFDRAWAFGTGRDYVNVFLWTLGLTQTGTQVVARVKSFTRA